MCNVQALITNSLLHMGDSDLESGGEVQQETLTYEFVPILLSLSVTHVLFSTAGPERSIKCFKNSCRWYRTSLSASRKPPMRSP